MMNTLQPTSTVSSQWRRLFAISAGSAYLYILSEWLFYVTKPSPLSVLAFGKQVVVLLFLGSSAALISLLPQAGLFLLSRFSLLKKLSGWLLRLGILVPAFILGALLLMLIDNFTYTLFKIGIVNSEGLLRAAFGLLFCVLFVLAYFLIYRRLLAAALAPITGKLPQKPVYTALSLFLMITIAVPLILNRPAVSTQFTDSSSAARLPNVILITSDGLNADHMSAYGYERDTTPNISQLGETSLVADNAFSNSGSTSGSIISILTGKYPANLRLLAPPDILRGDDSFQHLPGILRQMGYYSAQFSYPTFADAYTLNLLQGFDQANGRTATSGYLLKLNRILPTDIAYMTYEVGNRLIDRLLHIFFIKKMPNPFKYVTTEPDWKNDQSKLADLLDLIRSADQPLFIHYHYMGTHGPRYHPQVQHFSLGKNITNQELYDLDFYDDAVLEFDQNVGAILNELKKQGLYDQTIIIIGSDHGFEFNPRNRLPLIIHFPNDDHAGRISTNLENIQIAPTVLDYMDIGVPDWMDSTSILTPSTAHQPIPAYIGMGDAAASTRAPFYQFFSMTIVYCDRWYYANLNDFYQEQGLINGSTAQCELDQYPSDAQVLGLMLDHLERYGFDTSSLR